MNSESKTSILLKQSLIKRGCSESDRRVDLRASTRLVQRRRLPDPKSLPRAPEQDFDSLKTIPNLEGLLGRRKGLL